MPPKSSITDVLSGNVPVRLEASVDPKTVTYLVAGIFIAVLAGVIIARKLT